MSGGTLQPSYSYFQLHDLADSIDKIILVNGVPDETGFAHTFAVDVIDKFKEASHTLRQASAMARAVDWLVSGDTGEDSFRKEWNALPGKSASQTEEINRLEDALRNLALLIGVNDVQRAKWVVESALVKNFP